MSAAREQAGGSAAVTRGARVLLVGGSPEPSSPELVRRLAGACDYVVAVDRGLDRLMEAGTAPDLFCGDCDTASPAAASYLEDLMASGSCERETYDPYKDFTDLTLALRAVEKRIPGARLSLTCFGGGRPDHFLAVLGTLMRDARQIELVEDGLKGRIVRAGDAWSVPAMLGAHFSFIPLAPGTVVSERGMEWELDHHACDLLSDLGVSNVIRTGDAAIVCHKGCAVAYVFDDAS